MRLILIAYLCVILTSCAALDVAKKLIGGGGSGVTVDAQVGDKDQSVQLGDSSGPRDINVKGKGTVHVTSEVVNNGPSPLLYLLLIGGWILPTPVSMWRSIRAYFSLNRKKRNVK